jgi:hypothetical protein
MRLIAFLLSVMITSPTYAVEHKHEHENDRVIENSFELREWCKDESEAYYIAKGITPYNWSDSWWEKGNTLFVKGNWLIGHDHISVECRIAKGARKKYASFEILNK